MRQRGSARTLETSRLAGAYRAQPLKSDAFGLLQHALVPDGQDQFPSFLYLCQFLVCLWCQRNLPNRWWDHLGERSRLLNRLVPAGA